MMVFKRKQIVVLSLVLMIVVAGYLQYSYKRSSVSVSGKDGKLGEAVYVDNKDTNTTAKADTKITNDKQNAKDANVKTDSNSKTSSNTNTNANTGAVTNKDAAASKQANDFFAQAKLEKEITRGKDTDTLKAITEDPNASKEAKSKAFDQMTKIVNNSQKEMRIEQLLKEKNFSDALVLFGDDGSIDIVVKAPSLTSANAAQIADIVSRQANVTIDKIHIKNMF